MGLILDSQTVGNRFRQFHLVETWLSLCEKSDYWNYETYETTNNLKTS